MELGLYSTSTVELRDGGTNVLLPEQERWVLRSDTRHYRGEIRTYLMLFLSRSANGVRDREVGLWWSTGQRPATGLGCVRRRQGSGDKMSV
ncbi:hypothetical protein Hanom_Chr04g00314611 [Helianthus anomalus]